MVILSGFIIPTWNNKPYFIVFYLQFGVCYCLKQGALGWGLENKTLPNSHNTIINEYMSNWCLQTSLGCLLLTFHVRLGFVSLLACGGLCLLALAPRGGSLLCCFLFQHGPVKSVVILMVQSPKEKRLSII